MNALEHQCIAMPSGEFKKLLDRDRAIVSASPLIEKACPLLRELVDHGCWALARCIRAGDVIGGENEDIAAPFLFRHLLELTDGIEVLFRNSCSEAAVPLVRAAFETSIALAFILRDDSLFTQRSLSWVYCDLHDRVTIYDSLDPDTPSGRAFRKKYQADLGIKPPIFDAKRNPAKAAANLKSVLNRKQFELIAAEHEKSKKKHPSWFSLFAGPANLRELADTVDRGVEYHILYSSWSRSAHGRDGASYMRRGERPKQAAILAMRMAHNMAPRAAIVARQMLTSSRLLLAHYRPGEDLSAWYKREIQKSFLELSNLEVSVAEVER
jgi:hypothetical protein